MEGQEWLDCNWIKTTEPFNNYLVAPKFPEVKCGFSNLTSLVLLKIGYYKCSHTEAWLLKMKLTFGAYYFVEVYIVLQENMLLNQTHNISETLQEKLEQLPDFERAFVHIDLNCCKYHISYTKHTDICY